MNYFQMEFCFALFASGSIAFGSQRSQEHDDWGSSATWTHKKDSDTNLTRDNVNYEDLDEMED